MRLGTLAVAALFAAGCNQVFGLDPPTPPPAIDATAIDTSTGDALTSDAPIDSSTSAGIDAGTGIDAPCVVVDDGIECTADVCVNGVLMHPPRPRDTFCNGFNDQCDGYGNCVDCTTSGGCGECCVCGNQVCIPA